MKKFITFLLLSLSILVTVANGSQNDFRGAKWGMSREQVKRIEKEHLYSENDNILVKKSSLFENECFFKYYFEDKKLMKVEVVFTLDKTNYNELKFLYEKINNILKEKYNEYELFEKLNKTVNKSMMESFQISFNKHSYENERSIIEIFFPPTELTITYTPKEEIRKQIQNKRIQEILKQDKIDSSIF